MRNEPTDTGSLDDVGNMRTIPHGPPFTAEGAALRMAARMESDTGTKEELLREANVADSLEGAVTQEKREQASEEQRAREIWAADMASTAYPADTTAYRGEEVLFTAGNSTNPQPVLPNYGPEIVMPRQESQASRATRPPWLTPDMLGYIAGLVDGAGVWNAGHLPLDFLYSRLAWRFSLPAEDAREAVRVWREIRQPPEADEVGA